MMFAGALGKAAATVVTGLVGAVAWDGTKKVARTVPGREVAVVATSWGLKGVRRVETGAESARLATADVIAEARERNGEQTPVPAAAAKHDHEH